MTDGTYIYWDFAMGNPYYGLMPLKVENLWRGAFGTRQNLTGRLFSAIIFLHELAHRLGGIPFDGEDYELNRCNTLKIITNCVPQAFAPERFSQKLN